MEAEVIGQLVNIAVGDQLSVSLRVADSAPPPELEALLREDPALRSAWERLPGPPGGRAWSTSSV